MVVFVEKCICVMQNFVEKCMDKSTVPARPHEQVRSRFRARSENRRVVISYS